MSELGYKYIVLLVYFAILGFISYRASKRIHTSDDFFIAGKNLGYWVSSFSSVGESAWLFLGLSGMGAIFGASAYWIMLGEVACVAGLWFLMGKPLKKHTQENNCVTIPDYLESRFKSTTNTLRLLAAGTLAIFLTIYISSQIDAAGETYESFLGGNYYIGSAIGFGIVLMYCFGGGYVAACWTELFQGIVMFITLVVLPVIMFFMIDLDHTAIMTKLDTINPNFLGPWGPDGFSTMSLLMVFGFIMIGIGHMGSPQIAVRFISIRDEDEINKGRWVAVGFAFLTEIAIITVGIVGRYIFTDVGQDPIAILGHGGEGVLPMIVEKYFHPLIVGIYIAAILSAIMATVSALLVVASSAVTRDIYHRIFHPHKSEGEFTTISRVFTLGMGLLAFIISTIVAVTTPDRTIFWFVIFGWTGISATFCPVMILSLFWPGYTERGAITSIIVGFVSVVLFKFVFSKLGGIGPYLDALSALPPSFFLALFSGIIVSKCDAKKAKA